MRTLLGVSPRLEARVTGVLYLFSMLLGIIGGIFISRKMQTQGDWANVAAASFYICVIVLFWDLFRAVNRWLSTGIATFSLVGNWLPESSYKMGHTSITLYFGVYCLLIGCLILGSRFFPTFDGVLMVCAGVCWLTTTWPRLTNAISPYNAIGALVGEGTLTVYLLVKGLDERHWREQAEVA
jgi:hypothetical protein